MKINTRHIFNLLIPFFSFISIHAEQTAAPATPITVEAKNEIFVPQHPDQYLSWGTTPEQSERVDVLAEDPRLVILWAGHPFSRDYNRLRGHAFTVAGIHGTLRTSASKNAEDGPLPMAYWNYRGPDVAHLIQKDGEDGYSHGKWAHGNPGVVNNLGYAGCHNTTSPEFVEGKLELTLSRLYAARTIEAIDKPFERARCFDRQLMVYGQCHVEYYFDGGNRAVEFPWDDGTKVEDMGRYYGRIASSNWADPLSKTPMPRARYSGYETQITGTHDKNSMTYIDYHVSKVQNAKGRLYTDHKVDNPFDNFTQTCMSCHTQGEAVLQKVIAEHRRSVNDLKIKVEGQLVHAHFKAKVALDANAAEAEMKPIQDGIRHARQRWDLAIASHGVYMHISEEGLGMFGTTMNKVAGARIKLVRLLATEDITHEVQIPDISTRKKAQQAISLSVKRIKTEKQDSIKTVVPQWEEQAREGGLSSQQPHPTSQGTENTME